jgi:hypothetical protein
VRRHRIEHFVGQHQSVEMLGQIVKPAYAWQVMRRTLSNGFVLAGAQFTGHFEDGVTLGELAAPGEFEQQVGGELPAASADLDDLRSSQCEQLRDLRGQGLSEGGQISGAVTKSPPAPNLCAPPA